MHVSTHGSEPQVHTQVNMQTLSTRSKKMYIVAGTDLLSGNFLLYAVDRFFATACGSTLARQRLQPAWKHKYVCLQNTSTYASTYVCQLLRVLCYFLDSIAFVCSFFWVLDRHLQKIHHLILERNRHHHDVVFV